MSLGYFMNTRWGGLAAAVAAQQATTSEELHATLNPSSLPHHHYGAADETSNPFATFALPYGPAGPLSIHSAYPTGAYQHHHHQQQQQQQHHHHHHPHPAVQQQQHPFTAPELVGLDPALAGRLTSPSVIDERAFGLAKSLYGAPPSGPSSLIGHGIDADGASSMIWQAHHQVHPASHPHHSLPLSNSSSAASNTHPSLIGQQPSHHSSLSSLTTHQAGLLPILTPSSTSSSSATVVSVGQLPHQQSSEMPSDSPASQSQQSSSSGSKSTTTGGSTGSVVAVNGTSSGSSATNGVVTKPKAKPRQPEEVLKYFSNVLTPYECQEILNYPHVYFIGAMAKKRPVMSTHNSGYDDEQDSYIHVVHDHVAYRYEVLKVIGKGSFGQVVKAYDHKNHVYVALKMVRNQPRFHRQAQEEIKILEHLKKQDKDNKMNVIHLHDCFVFRNHVCITFELLSINLYELIKKNKFQGFSLQLVRKFAHSLLQCLEALARNRIIHCDMKPENVLLKQQGRSGIKVSIASRPRLYADIPFVSGAPCFVYEPSASSARLFFAARLRIGRRPMVYGGPDWDSFASNGTRARGSGPLFFLFNRGLTVLDARSDPNALCAVPRPGVVTGRLRRK